MSSYEQIAQIIAQTKVAEGHFQDISFDRDVDSGVGVNIRVEVSNDDVIDYLKQSEA